MIMLWAHVLVYHMVVCWFVLYVCICVVDVYVCCTDDMNVSVVAHVFVLICDCLKVAIDVVDDFMLLNVV